MKRLFQSNGNGAHRKSAIDSDLLRILVPPVICVVICCTFFVGASWAWFTDSATCGVEYIKAKSNFGVRVNVTVTDMSAVNLMLAPETSVSPESTPTEAPTPTAAPTTENAESQEQSEAQTSAPASQG